MHPWPALPDLWPARVDGPAFLTTFTFDAAFFELRLLPELTRRGAHPVVVLVDRDEGFAHAVDALATLDGAGRDYLLVPVALPGKRCFHPKVHFFPAQGVAVVGSGNLTPGGAGRNLEVADVLRRADAPGAVAAVARFFRLLLDAPSLGLDEGDRASLGGALGPARAIEEDGDVWFLHTLDAPLVPRLRARMGAGRFTEALLAAAFHDDTHATSLTLLDALGWPAAEVAADAAGAWPAATAARTGRLVEPLEGGKSRARPLHAKVIAASGPDGALVVTGSANLTGAAWWANNVEAVVIRRGAPGAFDTFRDGVRLEPRPWDPPRPAQPAPPTTPLVPVRWARAEAGVLTVGMDPVPEATFHLLNGPLRVPLALVPDGEGYSGPAEVPDARAALLQVDAPGHRRSVVVVHQPAFLATTGRAGRLRRILQRLDAGMADATDRRELFACLADALSAVQRAAPLVRRGPGASAPEKGAGAFHGETDEAILAAIADLPPGAAPTSPDLDRATTRLARLVDLLVGTSTADAERAADADEQAATEQEFGATPRRAAPKAARDLDEWTWEQSVRLSETHLQRLPETAAADPARAGVLHLTLLRLLGELGRKFPTRAATAALHRLRWLVAAWAVPEWPDPAAGWALAADIDPEPGALAALAEAFGALPAEAADANRDHAHRVVAGLAARGAPPQDPLTSALFGHVTSGARARAVVDPLWELEAAWLGSARDPARFQRAQRAAIALPALGARRGSLYSSWREARPRAGRRVRPAPRDGVCPACNTRLPAHAHGRLGRVDHVEVCPCGALLAHGEPEELHAR